VQRPGVRVLAEGQLRSAEVIRFMRKLTIAIWALVSLGCSDGIDPNPLLVGRWGSEQVELVALRSGAELRLHCAVIVVDEPIELAANDEFGARGELWLSTATVRDRPRATFWGTFEGNRLQVQVALPTQWFPLVLESGVAPPPEDVPVCPQ
jgi:hypothetical protein